VTTKRILTGIDRNVNRVFIALPTEDGRKGWYTPHIEGEVQEERKPHSVSPAGARRDRSCLWRPLVPRTGSRQQRSPILPAASRHRSRSTQRHGGHHAVDREQVGGVGTESRLHHPGASM